MFAFFFILIEFFVESELEAVWSHVFVERDFFRGQIELLNMIGAHDVEIIFALEDGIGVFKFVHCLEDAAQPAQLVVLDVPRYHTLVVLVAENQNFFFQLDGQKAFAVFEDCRPFDFKFFKITSWRFQAMHFDSMMHLSLIISSAIDVELSFNLDYAWIPASFLQMSDH